MRKLILLSVITLFFFSNVSAQKLTAFKSNNGLWGFMDSKTKAEIIKPQYNDAHGFSFGYAAVKKNGKWFYIDKSGNSVCNEKFDKAGNFNLYGEAVVGIDGKWGKLYIGSLLYDDCQLMKASGSMETIDKETYLQEEKLGWSKEEYDGMAEMDDATAKMWDAYANNKLAKPADDLYKKSTKKYFHKNGKISATGDEINGKKVGQWSFYNEKGCLVSNENYNNDGIADGNFNRYFCFEKEYGYTVYNPTYKTGSLKNGKQDGVIVYYNPTNGKPTYTELWENGVFKKVKDIYDSNGNLISSNGTGILEFYKEDSKYLSSKMEYQNGHRAGVGVWYHPNKTTSQVRQKALYKYDANDVNGLRWEIIEINDYNGNPLPKGTLKNGNGTWISYDDKDKPTIITTYQNGKKVKEETALAKDIDKLYDYISPEGETASTYSKAENTNPYAEMALSNDPYEVIAVKAELVSQNYGRAFQYAESGDKKGIAYCTGILGFLYHDGLGTQKDLSKAFQYYKKAAELGSAEAMYYLGLMYHNGEHVQKNISSAFVWFEKSAGKKIPEAIYLMSRAYYFGYPEAGIAVNYQKALEYAQNAKESYKDDPVFINHLAYCYFFSGNKKMAYGILQNLVKTHPNYANGFDSLGEVGLSLGFKEQAIANYKKAAQMGLENAIKWCKENGIKY